jgi:hypothetical protein
MRFGFSKPSPLARSLLPLVSRSTRSTPADGAVLHSPSNRYNTSPFRSGTMAHSHDSLRSMLFASRLHPRKMDETTRANSVLNLTKPSLRSGFRRLTLLR